MAGPLSLRLQSSVSARGRRGAPHGAGAGPRAWETRSQREGSVGGAARRHRGETCSRTRAGRGREPGGPGAASTRACAARCRRARAGAAPGRAAGGGRRGQDAAPMSGGQACSDPITDWFTWGGLWTTTRHAWAGSMCVLLRRGGGWGHQGCAGAFGRPRGRGKLLGAKGGQGGDALFWSVACRVAGCISAAGARQNGCARQVRVGGCWGGRSPGGLGARPGGRGAKGGGRR
jgi:hypothetical protein